MTESTTPEPGGPENPYDNPYIEGNRLWTAYEEGVRAALAERAAPRDDLSGGIDVERLAEALLPVTRSTWTSGKARTDNPNVVSSWHRQAAERIAAEYARLAEPSGEPT